jgi:quercetin dioxygenase-like cupin family protein
MRAQFLTAAAITAVLALATPSLVTAQQGNADAIRGHTDHRLFPCRENGLAGGQAYGCQLIARARIGMVPGDALFWHLTTFPSVRAAQELRGRDDLVAEAEGKVWLFSFGPRRAIPSRGRHVASVGPLPLPWAQTYEVVVYDVAMPAGAHTQVHTHPGPEAWYVIEGQQCLETPVGTIQARSGQAAVAPPGGTPMRLTNNGKKVRRALFIVIYDAALPWTAPSDWQPTDACDRDQK